MTANRLTRLSDNLRAFSGLLLIASFLVLGSCPMKKTVYTLIAGSHAAGQETTSSGKTLASAICSGVDSLNKKLNLPDRSQHMITPLVILLFATGLIFATNWKSDVLNILNYRGPALREIHPAPLYLRNRLLLI